MYAIFSLRPGVEHSYYSKHYVALRAAAEYTADIFVFRVLLSLTMVYYLELQDDQRIAETCIHFWKISLQGSLWDINVKKVSIYSINKLENELYGKINTIYVFVKNDEKI